MDSRFNTELAMRESVFFDGPESNQKYSRFWLLLVLAGSPLTLSSVSVGARAVVESAVLPVANEWADAHGWAITDVRWQGTGLIVRAEGPLPVPTTDELKADLDAAGIDTDRVTVNLVPIYKVELQ